MERRENEREREMEREIGRWREENERERMSCREIEIKRERGKREREMEREKGRAWGSRPKFNWSIGEPLNAKAREPCFISVSPHQRFILAV